MRLAAILPAILVLLPVVGTPAVGSFHETVGDAPDREFVLVMRGNGFNGFEHPSTPLLEAFVGERVRFTVVVPPAVAEPHTFHLHGHPWLDDDSGRVIDTILMRPGDVHAFVVTAGSIDRQPGDWMYHCHVDLHAAAGMWGIFRVYPFSTSVAQTATGFSVRLDRMGEAVEGAALRLELDGAPVEAHVVEAGAGRYEVHAPPLPAGALVVRASVEGLGESVARLALGGAPLAPPALHVPGGHHGAHEPVLRS